PKKTTLSYILMLSLFFLLNFYISIVYFFSYSVTKGTQSIVTTVFVVVTGREKSSYNSVTPVTNLHQTYMICPEFVMIECHRKTNHLNTFGDQLHQICFEYLTSIYSLMLS